MPTVFTEPSYPMRTATGNIKYYLVEEGPQFIQGRSSPEGEGITVRFHVRFDEYRDWLRAMRGWVDIDGPELIRHPPERIGWPQNPSDPFLSQKTLPYYATELQLLRCWGNGYESTDPLFLSLYSSKPQPVTVWNNWPRPKWTEWQATFSTLAYAVWDDDDPVFLGFHGGQKSEWNRYTIVRQRPAAENERVPLGQCVYRNPVTNAYHEVGEAFFRRGCITKLELRWVSVPRVPKARILSCSGKVNHQEFVIHLPGHRSDRANQLRYPRHTLLFDTYEISPVVDPWGQIVYDITYHFIAREDGRTWNKYRAPDNTLTELFFRHRGNDNNFVYTLPFEEADFAELFRM